MNNCIFCNIVKKEAECDIVYEDHDSIAFTDINKQAPVHILVIPKKHIRSLAEIVDADLPVVGHLFDVANKVAEQYGISKKGYRLVINCGIESGQSVWHLHIHVLGGRRMTWPPG
jgi:histidine triad (HIT) family protein